MTRSTSGSASSARTAASLQRAGPPPAPTRNRRLRSMSTIATTASSTPTRIDPIASGTGDPVTWCSPMPAVAMRMPTSAAASSKNTARTVGSEVSRTWSSRSRSCVAAARFACRDACRNEIPSSTNDTASTTYATMKSPAGSGLRQLRDAVRDRHPRAHREQPDRREQRPHVDLAAEARAGAPCPGGLAARRCAMIRKISLPVSAHECAASASIDADAVTTAAARLGDRDEQVGAERDDDRQGALALRGVRRARRPPRDARPVRPPCHVSSTRAG